MINFAALINKRENGLIDYYLAQSEHDLLKVAVFESFHVDTGVKIFCFCGTNREIVIDTKFYKYPLPRLAYSHIKQVPIIQLLIC